MEDIKKHDEAWKKEFDREVEVSLEVLRLFGKPSMVDYLPVLKEKLYQENSELKYFLGFFYDHTLIDGELSYALESGPKKFEAFHVNPRKKDLSANLKRFNDVMNLSFFCCSVASADGREIADRVRSLFDEDNRYVSFVYTFYDNLMFTVRGKFISGFES